MVSNKAMRAASPKQPSATEAKAAATVLADMSTIIGRDFNEWNGSSAAVVSDCEDASDSFTSLEEWRNLLADMPLRRMVLMRMFKVFSKSKLQHQSSVEWRRKLPTLLRLIEAAHYQESPTRDAYLKTLNLKERIQTLAMAFYNEMKKHGNGTFSIPSQVEKVPVCKRSMFTPLPIPKERIVAAIQSARQA